MSFLDNLLQELIQSLIGLRATQYTFVACAALLVYDYFLTLDREIFYVWGSKWSFGKVVFFLNRYSPAIDTTLAIYVLGGVKDQNICPWLSRFTAWMFVSGMYISQIILAMRTYAIWSGRRSMLAFLILFLVSVFTAAAVIMQRFLNALTFVDLTPILKSLGVDLTCAPVSAPGKTYLNFVIFMITEVVIASLTYYRGIQHYRITRNPLVKSMFQDGLMYYIYTSVFAIANVVVALVAPVQYAILLELPLRIVNSVCCTRVLLNIRGAYFNPNEMSHNGVITYTKGTIKWGSISLDESGTMVPSDSEEGGGGNGWMWPEPGEIGPLTLRPMSPFELEPPNIEAEPHTTEAKPPNPE